MSNQHTPGPWESGRIDDVHGNAIGYHIGQAMNLAGRSIARVLGFGPNTEAEANARLIAAAPELLQVLEALLADYICAHPEDLHDESASKARATIAKARGQS